MKKIIEMMREKASFLLKHYPVTFIFMIIGSFLIALGEDIDLFNGDFLEIISLFLIFFITGTIFTESYFDKRKHLFFYILFFILAIVLDITRDNSWITRISISYVLIINILSFYKFYLKSKKSLAEYLIKVFTNVLKTSFLYWVLSIGVLLIMIVFSYLIIDNFEIVWKVEIVLLGCVYFPSLLIDMNNTNNEIPSFIKILVKYILDSLVILAFVIIYLYVFKIIMMWSIPSNEIFRILSILFFMAFPIWTMNEYFKEKDFFQKVNNKLPLFFIPFVFLQIYSLGVRIINYGLTTIRYLGIILIMLEVIYLILYIFKRAKIDLMFIIICLYIVITLLIPHINMFDLSNRSQVSIIKKNLYSEKKEDITKVIRAYYYLKNSLGGDDYIMKYLKDDVSIIEKLKKPLDNNRFYYIHHVLDDETLDIKDYDKLQILSFQDSYEKDINNIQIIVEDIDITSLIKSYVTNEQKWNDDYFKLNHEVIMNNKKLIINDVSLSYDDENKILSYCEINGFILEKE